jgi:hypothetical protein
MGGLGRDVLAVPLQDSLQDNQFSTCPTGVKWSQVQSCQPDVVMSRDIVQM